PRPALFPYTPLFRSRCGSHPSVGSVWRASAVRSPPKESDRFSTTLPAGGMRARHLPHTTLLFYHRTCTRSETTNDTSSQGGEFNALLHAETGDFRSEEHTSE